MAPPESLPNVTGSSASSSSGTVKGSTNNIKLPTFSPDAPDLFFILMDAMFKQYEITDPNSIFLTTLMQLPQRVQMQAKSLISDNVEDKLGKLKKIVNSLYVLPAEQRLKQLLNSTSMGDMKPTEYLQYLRELQGSDTDPNSPLIRTYFLDSLPSTLIPFVRLMFNTHDLDSIAKAADNSVPYVSKPNIISISNRLDCVSQSNDPYISEHINTLATQRKPYNSDSSLFQEIRALRSFVETSLDNMQSQINNLNRQVSNINNYRQERFDSARRRDRSQSVRRAQSDEVGQNVCYYHNKFGEKAHKCIKPCNYKGN